MSVPRDPSYLGGTEGPLSSMSISTSSPGLSKLTSSGGTAVSRPERALRTHPPELETPPWVSPHFSLVSSLSHPRVLPSPSIILRTPVSPVPSLLIPLIPAPLLQPLTTASTPTPLEDPAWGPEEDKIPAPSPPISWAKFTSHSGKRRASGRVPGWGAHLPQPLCPSTPPIKSPSPTWAALVGRTSSGKDHRKLPRERMVHWPTTAGGQTAGYQ